jgi:hypothetical protein
VLQNQHDDQEPDQLSEVVAIPAKELAPEGPTDDPSVIVSAGDRKHLRARATSGTQMAQGKDFQSTDREVDQPRAQRDRPPRSFAIQEDNDRDDTFLGERPERARPAALSALLASLGNELPSKMPGEESPPDP